MATEISQHKRRESFPSFSLPPSSGRTSSKALHKSTDSTSRRVSYPPSPTKSMAKASCKMPMSKRPTSSPKPATSPGARKRKLSITQDSQLKLQEIAGMQLDEDFSSSSGSSDEDASYLKRRKISPWALGIKERRALANKVKLDQGRMPSSARKGMVNLTGALCYRNSLLQVLMHQPRLVAFLQTYHKPKNCLNEDPSKCVACCLHDLSKIYWQATDRGILTTALKRLHVLFRSLGWASDVSSGQADPDEQAGWLFGQLRSELPTSMASYLDAVQSITTTSVIRCKKCGYESRTEGHERSFSVPIQPAINGGTLAKYLQAYLNETVEGYRCEKCNDKSLKPRYHEIVHAPDVLTIQLKRFNWDGRKITRTVPIDVALNLNRHRAASHEENLQYELCGVIKHSGSLSGGHYISAAKGPDDTWCEFDDSQKSRSDVDDARGGRGRFTPYILFYQRKD